MNFEDEILKKKYLKPGENSWKDLCKRIRTIVALDDETLATKIYDIMLAKKFCPAGSILSNIGTDLSMSNCYYIPIKEDSIEGIFDCMKEMAKTFSWRGGVGIDISKLRYKGAKVANAAQYSSGSVSFLPLFSNTVLSIGQGQNKDGKIISRRGAAIASMEDTHPDIEDFIDCKADPDKVFGIDVFKSVPNDVSGMNLSVKVSNKFMQAVEADTDWDLIWNGETVKTIKAKDLFHKIAKRAWESADPGVLFWDTAKKYSTLEFNNEGIKGVNPCGEQNLIDYGSCMLSSFNLLAYSTSGEFNWNEFRKDIPVAVEFMNWVLDHNSHPLKKQREIELQYRKIGMGITGLADSLAIQGIKYSSKEGKDFAMDIMFVLTIEGFKKSSELAKLHGPAPILKDKKDYKVFTNQEFIASVLPSDLIREINEYGVRNTAVTSIAPTGSISIILGNVTSGCEPLFQKEYTRTSRVTEESHKIIHPPAKEYDIPLDNYETSDKIHWKDRIDMQAALQCFCTDSISSTINLPATTTVKEIEKIFKYAWEKELKGVTIYRDGSKDMQVLNKKEEKVPEESLPDILAAERHKVCYKNSKTYITVSKDKSNYPVEVFVSLPSSAGLNKDTKEFEGWRYLETLGLWHALVRLVSLCLRNNIPLKSVVKQLKKSSYIINDLPGLLNRVLSRYIILKDTKGIKCPECESFLVSEGGCMICKNCGYSKCS